MVNCRKGDGTCLYEMKPSNETMNCKYSNQFALTFDDGPYLNTTPKLLPILKDNGVKATFFVTGKQFTMTPDFGAFLRQIDKEGHEIYGHSWNHEHLQEKTE